MPATEEVDTAAVPYSRAPQRADSRPMEAPNGAPEIEIPTNSKARRAPGCCCGRGGCGRPFAAGCLFGVVVLVLLAVGMVKVLDGAGMQVGIMEKDDGEIEDDVMVDLGATGAYTVPKESYLDAATKVVHPASIRAGHQAKELMVLGGGVVKYVLGPIRFKISSVALYVDPVAAREELDRFKGVPPSELREDPSFFDALQYGRFDKALRVVMRFPVAREDMDAESRPQLRRRLSNEGDGKGREDSIFSNVEPLYGDDTQYAVGDVIVASVTNGKFTISLNGDTRPEMEDQVFNHAYFGMYLDAATPYPWPRPRYADRAPLLWLRESATEDAPAKRSVWAWPGRSRGPTN